MSEPRVLDARFLPPPEPFVQAMEALDSLAPGEQLLLLLYREPFPLYKVLAEHGYTRETRQQADGTFEILITRQAGSGG